jgi:hypothetical protein
MAAPVHGFPWREALPAGLINAAINGWISWGQFSPQASVPLTLDSIAGGSHSAIGSAVMVATALGFILTLVIFALTHRKHGAGVPAGRPLYAAAIKAALGNALGLFGLLVVLGVVWQRAAGSVDVSPLVATGLVAGVAGGVSIYLEGAVRGAYRRAMAGA